MGSWMSDGWMHRNICWWVVGWMKWRKTRATLTAEICLFFQAFSYYINSWYWAYLSVLRCVRLPSTASVLISLYVFFKDLCVQVNSTCSLAGMFRAGKKNCGVPRAFFHYYHRPYYCVKNWAHVMLWSWNMGTQPKRLQVSDCRINGLFKIIQKLYETGIAFVVM